MTGRATGAAAGGGCSDGRLGSGGWAAAAAVTYWAAAGRAAVLQSLPRLQSRQAAPLTWTLGTPVTWPGHSAGGKSGLGHLRGRWRQRNRHAAAAAGGEADRSLLAIYERLPTFWLPPATPMEPCGGAPRTAASATAGRSRAASCAMLPVPFTRHPPPGTSPALPPAITHLCEPPARHQAAGGGQQQEEQPRAVHPPGTGGSGVGTVGLRFQIAALPKGV